MTGVVAASRDHEAWLASRLRLIQRDLSRKHEAMREAPFPFLRATFYRWCQIWPELCPDAAKATELLAVGDLHVENFGTWRDREGRLAWGINDFDEAARLPWTIDLVRLATSALLAIDAAHLCIGRKEACDVIVEGYREALRDGGRPIVLGEHHRWLREIATGSARDPFVFWKRLDALPSWRGPVPRSVSNALRNALPEAGLAGRVVHRVSGLGSLGRERFAVVADWRGARVAREAKRLTTSAAAWAAGRNSERFHCETILARAVRNPDPFLHVEGDLVVRRLAPDCSRIELSALPRRRDESRLLYEMGFETANVHLGSRSSITRVASELDRRPAKWLRRAAKRMVDATVADWREWRRAWNR